MADDEQARVEGLGWLGLTRDLAGPVTGGRLFSHITKPARAGDAAPEWRRAAAAPELNRVVGSSYFLRPRLRSQTAMCIMTRAKPPRRQSERHNGVKSRRTANLY
jgi:hypothetical protein